MSRPADRPGPVAVGVHTGSGRDGTGEAVLVAIRSGGSAGSPGGEPASGAQFLRRRPVTLVGDGTGQVLHRAQRLPPHAAAALVDDAAARARRLAGAAIADLLASLDVAAGADVLASLGGDTHADADALLGADTHTIADAYTDADADADADADGDADADAADMHTEAGTHAGTDASLAGATHAGTDASLGGATRTDAWAAVAGAHAGAGVVVGVPTGVDAEEADVPLADVMASHRLIHVGEVALFRDAVAAAAEEAGLAVVRLVDGDVAAEARARSTELAALGRVAGRPWRRAEREAAAAALLALTAEATPADAARAGP